MARDKLTLFSVIVDPENACLDDFSVDAVAAAVSGLFRELPEPLLTRELCDEFISATGEYLCILVANN